MNKLPNLRQLYYLTALFEHKHFGRAAEACFVTQSTLSAAIAELESFLGIDLLEREHKSFVFTSLGESLVHRSRSLLEKSVDLVEYARNQGRLMPHTLKIGCIPTIAPFLIAPLLASCKKTFPELRLFIREDTTENALRLLNDGQLDMVILALPYETKKMHTEVLYQDFFDLVFPESWRDKIAYRDMNDWPDESIFLLEREHCLTDHAMNACSLNKTRKINPFYSTSLHTLTQMVNSELGVTFLPQMAIKNGILDGTRLSSLPMPGAYREIGVAYRRSSSKASGYQMFASLLEAVLNDSINHGL